MRRISREEIQDYVTYGEQREAFRQRILAVKELRRVHCGEWLTFLFENRDTVKYQIQEMMRTERIVKETDIRHEIETYNELLGGPGELGCTLLIEIAEPELRDRRLREWLDLPGHLYVVAGGKRIYARFDTRQLSGDRISSVHYLKFPVGSVTPMAVGADIPGLTVEATLSEAQMAALAEDLAN